MAQATADALQADGWEVVEGKLVFTRGHMYGNNPESVYGVFVGLNVDDVPLYAMGDTDAILWTGCTPPSLEYFSIRSYLFESTSDRRLLDRTTTFANVFGSLGDSANNLHFNTTGGSTSPGNFNRTASLIVTGNLPSASAVAGALVESGGFPEEAINYDFMPPELLNMSRDGLAWESYVWVLCVGHAPVYMRAHACVLGFVWWCGNHLR